MDRVFRTDFAELRWDKAEEMPNGWLKVPAVIGRSGVFPYQQPDGTVVREYRPPDEVGHTDSVSSFDGVPFTIDHPPLELDDQNTTAFSKGITNRARYNANDKHVEAQILIFSRDAKMAAQQTHRQLSPGYTVLLDPTPGMTPDGERYDVIQRVIRGNHVAGVPQGRQGPEVAFRFDARDAAVAINPEENTMTVQRDDAKKTKITIGDKSYSAGAFARAIAKAISDLGAEEEEEEEKPKDKNKDVAELPTPAPAVAPAAVTPPAPVPTPAPVAAPAAVVNADADKLQAKYDAAMERLNRMPEEIEVRSDLLSAAKGAIGAGYSGRTDSGALKTVRQIQEDVIAKVLGTAAGKALEGRSDGYVEGRYETALERLDEQRNHGERLVEIARQAHQDGGEEALHPAEAARRKDEEERRNAWKTRAAS